MVFCDDHCNYHVTAEKAPLIKGEQETGRNGKMIKVSL